MASKQPCKNHPSFTYSGKESSPLGLGYSAEAEDPGTVMEGRDKTMWMVGIRNGVKIWNRIPSQIVATVTKPMAKEEVVMREPAPAPPVEPAAAVQEVAVAAPKKRAPPKKKVVVEEDPEVAPAPAPAEEVKVEEKKVKKAPKKKQVAVEADVAAPEEAKEEVKVEEKKVKKAPKKKQVAAEADVAVEEGEKKKKKPNSFNIYMSYRTDQLKREDPSLDHKQRFQQASNEWKLLDDARKQQLIEEARAWKENQAAQE